MIEIIPNWHPIFVHFTVALWSLAIVFNLVAPLLPEGKTRQDWLCLARWNIWLGTAFGVITATAGWFAYNSVLHDATSHVAMTNHRNWALVTLGFFVLLTAWSIWCARHDRLPGKLFLAGLVIGGALLAGTAWRGAEVVYRYGVGVMSLPKPEVEGHSHHHDDTVGETGNGDALDKVQTDVPESEITNDGHSSGHDHDH